MKSDFDFSTYVKQLATLIDPGTKEVEVVDAQEIKASFVINACAIDVFCAPEKSSIGVFRCDFGAPPSNSIVQSYGSLLRFNFQHYSPGGCSMFGMDPASGSVVFHSELLLEILSPQMTLDYMTSVAAMRQLWREGRL